MISKRLISLLLGSAAGLILTVPPAAASQSASLNPPVPGPCTRDVALPAVDGSTVRLPAGDSINATDCTLDVGVGTGGVVALQLAMRACNLRSAITIDGIYGPLMKAEVRALQSSLGVPADGRYGPATRDAMTWPDATDECTHPTHV